MDNTVKSKNSAIDTLAHLGHLSHQEARELFSTEIVVRCEPEMKGNRSYQLASEFAATLLNKMFPNVTRASADDQLLPAKANPPGVVLNFGGSGNNQNAGVVYANCKRWMVHVDTGLDFEPNTQEEWNPVLALTTGCYAAARAAARVFGPRVEAAESLSPFSILDFRSGAVQFDWTEPLNLAEIHMAGIGAVGSALLFAMLHHGAAEGKLILVDHDIIDSTNIERYCLFETGDCHKKKVEVAKKHLESALPHLEIVAVPERMQHYVNSSYAADPSFKIPRLISAPDRRDTRREFQTLLPTELWDASTGPDDLIIHHNTFNPEQACLACIYPPDPSEDAHFKHVSETLNVPLARIKSGDLIDDNDAQQIRQRYPELPLDEMIGRPFDTVFHQLCAGGKIRLQAGDEIVITPFPFVSALAGVLLYFELVKTLRQDRFGAFQNHNYIRLNPFFNPNPSLKKMLPSSSSCPVCKNSAMQKTFARLWR
jgi:hypothetical protein